MVGPSSVPPLSEIIKFHDALELERALHSSLGEHGAEASARFIVWRTEQALIVPRGMPSRTGFAEAAHRAVALGWPVHERDTGGDLTPQAPGVVNISLAFRDASPSRSIGRAYERLLKPIIDFLNVELGVRAYASAIDGSFCDGAYNVAVSGLKLAGTAQRWRLSRTREGQPCADVLAHVALMSQMELGGAIQAINEFYRLCGIDKSVWVNRHTDLKSLVGEERSHPPIVAANIARFLAQLEL